MANCINCGGELFENSKFCPHCGTPVLEVSSHSEVAKIKEYESNGNLEGEVEGLPDINTAELTPEEQAAVLEMAAEKVMEDIPFIKKIDDISADTEKEDTKAESVPENPEIHNEEASEKVASQPAEEKTSEMHDDVILQTEEKHSEIKTETVDIPTVSEKKSKGGLIAIIAIAAVAAVGGAVFFMSQNNEPVVSVEQTETIPEMTTVISEDTAAELTEEISETDISSETVLSSEISSEIGSDMTSPETPNEETTSEISENSEGSEISESSSEEAVGGEINALAEEIVIEPKHASAMGSGISAEISLSAEGIDNSTLTDGVLFLAEYTSQASAPENITPVAMVIRIGDSSVDVSAASSSEGVVIFEYAAMKAAVEAAGFTADDIDFVAFRSTGVPIDVFKITIFQG